MPDDDAAALHPLDDLWWASKRGALALVVGLFPFLFILDEATDAAFSPVLPGLLTLLLLAIVLPLVWMEIGTRLVRDSPHLERRALRARQTARAALGIAVVWLLLWFAVGA